MWCHQVLAAVDEMLDADTYPAVVTVSSEAEQFTSNQASDGKVLEQGCQVLTDDCYVCC